MAVCPKVRVADVLPIEGSGIDSDTFKYALQAHFDFVVTDATHTPVFAVEFDGPGHRDDDDQIARDLKKNSLCARFAFPLLRINDNYVSRLYNQRTLLVWIVEVYELQKAFAEAQDRGAIPLDEPFDPMLFITSGDSKETFPFWIGRRARLRLLELAKSGAIPHAVTSGILWFDDDGTVRGLEFLEVSESMAIVHRTAMRPQLFPINFAALLSELLVIFLVERLETWLSTKVGAEPLDRVQAEYDLRFKVSCTRAHYAGPRE
jgi:very-short-patch-repair endonuclease